MPELPEVENIKQALLRTIKNCQAAKIQINTPQIILSEPNLFERKLSSAKILNIERKGKNLIITLSKPLFLIIHLKMTGQILITKSFYSDKHTHLIIKFKGKTGYPVREYPMANHGVLSNGIYFIYRDVRKFGYFKILNRLELDDFLKKLGPDALSVKLDDFRRIILSHNRKIKSLLLNQRLISGLGNIYCDELLFRAGIHPETKSALLNKGDVKRLHREMGNLLKEAIAKGGSSISDYLKPDAVRGNFQKFHKVYGRQGQKCCKCSKEIKKIRVSQRGTCYCPYCQTKKSQKAKRGQSHFSDRLAGAAKIQPSPPH